MEYINIEKRTWKHCYCLLTVNMKFISNKSSDSFCFPQVETDTQETVHHKNLSVFDLCLLDDINVLNVQECAGGDRALGVEMFPLKIYYALKKIQK